MQEEDENSYKVKGTMDIRVPYQISYWAKELNVSRETLKLAPAGARVPCVPMLQTNWSSSVARHLSVG